MLNFDVPDMYVKDYDNVFPGKQEALLNALKSAEKEHGKDASVEISMSKPLPKKRRTSTKSYRNQESIFKVPEVPFKVGNVRRTMSKSTGRRGNWIKYDLSNVDDMSESTNAQAALSFLKELDDRKRKTEDLDEEVDPQNFKPVFKKRDCSSNSDRKTNVQSTKKVTPTDTQEPPSRTLTNENTVSSVIKLNHLNFDDE